MFLELFENIDIRQGDLGDVRPALFACFVWPGEVLERRDTSELPSAEEVEPSGSLLSNGATGQKQLAPFLFSKFAFVILQPGTGIDGIA